MNLNSQNDLRSALVELHVPTVAATPQFRKWCSDKYPGWRFAEVFYECLPSEWFLVADAQYDLCYLDDEHTIQNTNQRLHLGDRFRDSGLMSIGALMDGSLLLINTREQQRMSVGSLHSDHVLETEPENLDPTRFRAFPFSYEEWLRHIKANPDDNRYL